MKTAIVTGANGFIGSHLVSRLLGRGWKVHALGRARGASSWGDRVGAALLEVGCSEYDRGQLECHEVDLISAQFGLNVSGAAAETMLFHVAGDTRFTPPDPALQREINVRATLNLVEGLKGKVGRVVHVSTAYVAGRRSGLIREEELDCGQSFWNSYEESKFEAEAGLLELCQKRSVPLIILRPSIVTNDRQSGRASTMTHLNALVEVISRLQRHYKIGDGQVVSKKIRLLADPLARPNLVPIDSILPAMLTIAESSAAVGKVFHLCHPRPQTNAEMVDLVCQGFAVENKLAFEFLNQVPKPLSRTEEMILRSLRVYAPYLNNCSEFDLTNSRAIVPDYDEFFTPMDVSYIRKIIEVQRASGAEKAHQQAAF